MRVAIEYCQYEQTIDIGRRSSRPEWRFVGLGHLSGLLVSIRTDDTPLTPEEVIPGT